MAQVALLMGSKNDFPKENVGNRDDVVSEAIKPLIDGKIVNDDSLVVVAIQSPLFIDVS